MAVPVMSVPIGNNGFISVPLIVNSNMSVTTTNDTMTFAGQTIPVPVSVSYTQQPPVASPATSSAIPPLASPATSTKVSSSYSMPLVTPTAFEVATKLTQNYFRDHTTRFDTDDTVIAILRRINAALEKATPSCATAPFTIHVEFGPLLEKFDTTHKPIIHTQPCARVLSHYLKRGFNISWQILDLAPHFYDIKSYGYLFTFTPVVDALLSQ
jgi:hypothetical protein